MKHAKYFIITAILLFPILPAGCSDMMADLDKAGDRGSGSIPESPDTITVGAGNTRLVLTWPVVAGAEAYEVWYCDTNDPSAANQYGTDITVTNCEITGLVNGTSYYVWIKAKNGAGTSDFGSSVTGIPNIILVTYNAGSGTIGSAPADGTGYDYNDTVTVLDNTGSLAGPEIRDGIRQRFTGWNTAANGGGFACAPGATFAATESVTLYAQYTTGSEVLRKVGPAGGWVFYDAGSPQAWGRYLEAANGDLPAGVWGTYPHTVPGADGTAIGTGLQNTLDIVSGDPAGDKAADRCASYSVVYGGVTYDNWFLPSIDELNAIYSNLFTFGAGGVFGTATYWSSTEDGEGHANTVRFYLNGTIIGTLKINVRNIRPVRYF